MLTPAIGKKGIKVNTISLKMKRKFVRDKIQQKLNGENIMIDMYELYHEQYKGLEAIKLYSLHHFPNYPLNKRKLVKKCQQLTSDFIYDINRPILVVKDFPVEELPYEHKILIEDNQSYIDIIIDGHLRAAIFISLGVDSILAFIQNDIKTYNDLNQLFLDINSSNDYHADRV